MVRNGSGDILVTQRQIWAWFTSLLGQICTYETSTEREADWHRLKARNYVGNKMKIKNGVCLAVSNF